MMDLFKRVFRRTGVDRAIYVCVFVLTIFGIVMIGSASIGQTASKGTTYATVNMLKQAAFVVVGYVAMTFFARCFKKKWINSFSTWLLYCVGIVSLLICLLWPSDYSYAWIRIGSFTIQPSEFMKIIMILFLSFHFGEMEDYCVIPKGISKETRQQMLTRKFWYCVARPLLVSILVFAIIAFIQRDLGSGLILALIVIFMFFIVPRSYYTKYKKIIGCVLAVLVALVIFACTFVLESYQIQRFVIWLNPLSDPLNSGFQLVNSMIAFSSGGLFGKGFGNSTQKFGYIPESHNDFIAAIIFEELGIIGLALILIPFCVIIYRLFYYGTQVKKAKSKMILYGVGIYFFIHLLFNLGGVSGLIPMTGVPLLMISSGGSSTIASMISLGIAQSIIAQHNKENLKEQIE